MKYTMLERVYKKVKDTELIMKIYSPVTNDKNNKSAILFFFGGGWVGGNMDQFQPHCKELAEMGMVAITVDYRVKSRHGVTPFHCIEDGIDAVHWVKDHSKELGVEPKKIIVAGGSAGGHVAACTAIFDKYRDEEDMTIPRAMVLFNPVVDTTISGYGYNKLGKSGLRISPVHHINKNLPPTLIFHGAADQTVPFENIERFERVMEKKENTCIVISYPGEGHGFFNYGRTNYNQNYKDTMDKTKDFLSAFGFLD